jgi:hypothetical protein
MTLKAAVAGKVSQVNTVHVSGHERSLLSGQRGPLSTRIQGIEVSFLKQLFLEPRHELRRIVGNRGFG